MKTKRIIVGAAIVWVATAANGAAQTRRHDPRIAALLEMVSEERLTQTLKQLEGFGTRHLLSSTTSPTQGIGAARQWILEEFKRSSPRLKVDFDVYQVLKQGERITRDVELRNVVAILPGRTPRRFYVSGHYDTVARPAGSQTFSFDNGDLPAPGVNDDGSGTALVLELARVFAQSGVEFDATLVFVAFAGEEQGLVGSSLHAQKALAEKIPIEGVLNNDIVGSPRGGNGLSDSKRIRVFSEGPEDSPSRGLARYIRWAAAEYFPTHTVQLVARHDRFGRGGDHSPFNARGFAAVRFTESNETYSRQHTVDDTFEGVNPAYLARNARVNAAALASLALAPSAPQVADTLGRMTLGRGTSGYDAVLRWRASVGATAYRVVWRDAWSVDWQFERVLGNVTELLLPNVSIDDYIFGVAAIGADGQESVVAAYVNQYRSFGDIRTR